MTVVVATPNMILSDSQLNGGVSFRTGKICRIRESLVGVSGCWGNALRFLEWLRKNSRKPPEFITPEDDDDGIFEAIQVLPNHSMVYWSNHLTPTLICEPYHAIGAGSEYAIGAMDAGATPEQATEIAITRCSECGPPVTALYLKHKSKRRNG